MSARPLTELGPTATQLRARAAAADRDRRDAVQTVAPQAVVVVPAADALDPDRVKHYATMA